MRFGLLSGSLVKLGLVRAWLSHALATQRHAVCAMHQAVEHRIGDCWVADMLVPVVHRHLAGDDGRGAAVPVIDDLQQVAALLGGERRDGPVVQSR